MFVSRMSGALSGYIRFAARGGFSERFLNRCALDGIKLWDVEKAGDTMYGSVHVGDYRKIRPAARDSGVRMKIVRKHGVRFKVYRYRRRTGMVVGLLLFAAALFFLSGRVWTVEVKGNVVMSDSEVMEYFSSLGVRPGVRKKDIDPSAISLYILQNNSEIAWSSVNVTGSNAVIEIRETDVPDDLLDESKPYNVRASYAGQITSINTFIGTAEVERGDAVEKGDLLISGIVENQDGSITYKAAAGEVMARTVRTLSAEVKYENTETEYTGREKTHTYIELFGVRVPLFIGGTPDFEYELETGEDRMIIQGKGLPFAVYTERFRETAEHTVRLSESEALARAGKELEELEKAEIVGDVISSEYSENVGEDGVIVSKTYVCEENIAYREILDVE